MKGETKYLIFFEKAIVEVWNIGKLFHKVTSTVHVRKKFI